VQLPFYQEQFSHEEKHPRWQSADKFDHGREENRKERESRKPLLCPSKRQNQEWTSLKVPVPATREEMGWLTFFSRTFWLIPTS
jgi:hypothetical protein